MTITRDPDVPEEAARLLAAFDRMAGEVRVDDAFQAAWTILIMAINKLSAARGGGEALAGRIAAELAGMLEERVREQWHRRPQPTDIEVHHGH